MPLEAHVRRGARLLVATGVGLVPAAQAAAQVPDDHLDKYLGLTETYCSDRRDQALRRLSAWGPIWIDWGVDELLDAARDAEDDEVAVWVQRAQVAFLLHAHTVVHGAALGLRYADFESHVEAALELLRWFSGERERLPRSRTLRPRDFYLPLVSAELLAGRPNEAAHLAEGSLEDYGRDVPMLLLAGCAEDMRAMVVRQSRGGQWPDRYLQRAETRFRKALDLDPGNDSGLLRLGWVLVRRNRNEEAREHLETVVREAYTDGRRFLGYLFMGAALEGSGDLEGAISSYRRAIDVVPDGQAAHIALARALERAAGQEASRQVLQGFFAERSRAWVRDDPWDEYAFGPVELRTGPLERLIDRLCP